MSFKRLWLNSAPDILTVNDFIWRLPENGPLSLATNIDPTLSKLGAVIPTNRDAVWLAATVFLADRTTPRRKGWQRNLQIDVPTTDPALWNRFGADIDFMLSFLTSDVWETSFTSGTVAFRGMDPEPTEPSQSPSNLVCLFSGGADSVCGVVRAIADGRRITLMSHWDWTGHAAIQTRLANDLEEILGVEFPHIRVNLGRKARQIGGGLFGNEPSRRSRTLLFVALGLAAASAQDSIPLLVAENGFTSLNPPLAPERRGALSTRTTHPEFLGRLRTLMGGVGAHSQIVNPFEYMTKGQMFSTVVDIIGPQNASRLLSHSHSCAHVRWAMQFGLPPATHCGVCYGCLIRRAAFASSGLNDQTKYLMQDLNALALGSSIEHKARAEIETMRYAINREFGLQDALALNLPESFDIPAAIKLIRRGFQELALMVPP